MSNSFINLTYDDILTADTNYYRETSENSEQTSLIGNKTFEVAIVGGGLSGLATAKFLADLGQKDIAIIEQHHVGWGASGRNGGEVIPGTMVAVKRIARTYGLNRAKELYDLSALGVDLVISTAQALGIECDIKQGYLSVIEPHGFSQDYLKKEIETLEKIGNPATIKNADDVQAMLGSYEGRYEGGIYYEKGYHFHPLKYLYGLKKHLVKNGVSIFEKTPCIHFEEKKDNITVKTPQGTITAKKIIFCGDSYLGTLVPFLRRKYVLIRNAIIATEPIAEEIKLLPSDVCVSELTGKLLFYRKTVDNRLLLGGGDNIGHHDDLMRNKEQTKDLCQKAINTLFPQIKDAEITHVWGGYIGVTPNYLPYVGSQNGRIYYMGGYSGHGVNLTHIMGKLVAHAVHEGHAGTNSAFDQIKHFPLPGTGRLDAYLARIGMALETIRERIG